MLAGRSGTSVSGQHYSLHFLPGDFGSHVVHHCARGVWNAVPEHHQRVSASRGRFGRGLGDRQSDALPCRPGELLSASSSG